MKINAAKVKDMHPTQITVGMLEVKEKEDMLSKMNKKELDEFLRKSPIPAVIGPMEKMYLTDHHHLGRALTNLKIDKCFFIIQHDLSTIPLDKFFLVMETLELLHPYDENGQKKEYLDIPHHIEHLIDDPYRSLAGFVRKHGGFIKSEKAYTEFFWADYFRKYISLEEIKQDLNVAIDKALQLAQKPEAKNLPGFIPDLGLLFNANLKLEEKIIKHRKPKTKKKNDPKIAI